MEQLNIATLEEKAEQEKEDEFRIDDDHGANWALKKIREFKSKIAKKEQFAEKEIAEIKSWLEGETNKLESDIERFEGLLTEYAMKMKEKDKDLKTHSLPAGDLKFRKQRSKWDYEDEKLIESAKSAGLDDLIKTEEKIDKRKLKKRVKIAGNKIINKETGEVIEGVEIIERGEKFSVKVND